MLGNKILQLVMQFIKNMLVHIIIILHYRSLGLRFFIFRIRRLVVLVVNVNLQSI